jgi:hypothetical protein
MRIEVVLVCCQRCTWRTLSPICFVNHPIHGLYSAPLTHSIDLPLEQVPKPTTAYLDESEPILKIPLWRGCAAAHESVNNAWVPILEQPIKARVGTGWTKPVPTSELVHQFSPGNWSSENW